MNPAPTTPIPTSRRSGKSGRWFRLTVSIALIVDWTRVEARTGRSRARVAPVAHSWGKILAFSSPELIPNLGLCPGGSEFDEHRYLRGVDVIAHSHKCV